jgi:pimeloyl-ACP methyl ester carboxylesterase
MAEAEDEAPQAAGLFGFDPRSILRATTVLMMKDRAGKVGAHGVGPLLRDLLAAKATGKFHLIGHSYGCKVLLSAVCADDLPRRVNSMLLLQPAISYLAFATDAGRGRPGGYRPALDRVEQPILATYSNQDVPLHNFFHWVVRREADLGEAQIAGAPPSRFAALGGYGPPDACGADCEKFAIKPFGEQYQLGSMPPHLIGLDGTGVITGHGDFCKEDVYWALFNQFNS